MIQTSSKFWHTWLRWIDMPSPACNSGKVQTDKKPSERLFVLTSPEIQTGSRNHLRNKRQSAIGQGLLLVSHERYQAGAVFVFREPVVASVSEIAKICDVSVAECRLDKAGFNIDCRWL